MPGSHKKYIPVLRRLEDLLLVMSQSGIDDFKIRQISNGRDFIESLAPIPKCW